MVTLGPVWVVASLYDEGVGLAAHHVDLRDEETVDVPGDAPPYVTCGEQQREFMY